MPCCPTVGSLERLAPNSECNLKEGFDAATDGANLPRSEPSMGSNASSYQFTHNSHRQGDWGADPRGAREPIRLIAITPAQRYPRRRTST